MTEGHGADLIIDGVGRTTFTGNLDAVADHGHIISYGMASGPPAPIPPSSLGPRAISVSGGHLHAFLRTREELLKRANEVLQGIREGWLRLRIDEVFPLEKAPDAYPTTTPPF